MKRCNHLRRGILSLAAFGLVLGATAFCTSEANAQHGIYRRPRIQIYANFGGGGLGGGYHSGHHGGHHGGYGYQGPVYHAPSVHYDTQYHHEYSHFTPRRGWHSHGHYDVVPHYTPGHFDYHHGNHVDLNPRYHYPH